MAAPEPSVVELTNGYHPLGPDMPRILAGKRFDELLAVGTGLPDVVDLVGEARIVFDPPVQMPTGVYWFTGVEPSCVLYVQRRSAPMGPQSVPPDAMTDGTPLAKALDWHDHLWPDATRVPKPAFAVGDEVVVSSTGLDGLVRARQLEKLQWTYTVFSGSRNQKYAEPGLSARPTLDDPLAWVRGSPVSPDRFAATLTRAKLAGHFTDTVFSFRATRTLFRPYQFKPVVKLLNSDRLRMLVADEVGLGKTIEAGLLWTEMEARRQADRVLVVCPSALVVKWQREMEERFAFSSRSWTSASWTPSSTASRRGAFRAGSRTSAASSACGPGRGWRLRAPSA